MQAASASRSKFHKRLLYFKNASDSNSPENIEDLRCVMVRVNMLYISLLGLLNS